MKLAETKIPAGPYCYTISDIIVGDNGHTRIMIDPCPYWDSVDDKHEQECGYCHYLEVGDWMDNGTMLLWDQVKECGVNDEY